MSEINAQPDTSAAGTGCGASFEPCSCCRALAMVRIPSALPDMSAGAPSNGGHRDRKPAYSFNFMGLKIKQRNNGRHKPPEATPVESAAWEEDLSVPKKRQLWEGWEGLAVCIFGIALPVFLYTMSLLACPKRITLVILDHPIEAILELALMVMIPLMNWRVWSSFCKNNPRFSLKRGIALGAALGTSLMIIAISVAAMITGAETLQADIGTNFLAGFCWLAILGCAAGATSLYLLFKLRATREFSKSKAQVVTFGAAGVALAALAFIGAEAKPFYVRFAEKMALSSKAEESSLGMQMLRQLYPERELRMECSDSRAAGLSGLFIPIKTSAQRQLYFAMTGQPYSFREFNNNNISSMPDDYVKQNFVGDKVKGLSLIRSSMEADVHPDILSSTLSWTYVFKNNTTSSQTARAQLVLPPGAVIHNLTWWKEGEEMTAAFNEKSHEMSYSSSQADGTVIKAEDLGHGRVVISCTPVSPDQELQMRITIVSPLKADSPTQAKLVLPKFLATNFDLDGEHRLKLHSKRSLLCSAISDRGSTTLAGPLKKESLESTVVVTASRQAIDKTVAVLDEVATDRAEREKRDAIENKISQEKEDAEKSDGQIQIVIDGSKSVQRQLEDVNRVMAKKAAARRYHPTVHISEKRYVIQQIQQLAASPPDHLVVVVDGSSAVKPFAQDIASALSQIPTSIHTSILLAREEGKDAQKFTTLDEGVSMLNKADFAGGQDNLPAVVKAAQYAGTSARGAVLWIHGPQPVLNEEIYIMDSYAAKPDFFEMTVGAGATDTYEYFKNQPSVGPFTAITRENEKPGSDLRTFLAKWQPHTKTYELAYSVVEEQPENIAALSDQEKEEIVTLEANHQITEELTDRNYSEAAKLASSYEIVTPVSSAVIHNTWVPGSASAEGNSSEARIDASVVSGVNTAGTVRVNNLANLEALLNIVANFMEIACALIGAIIVLNGLTNRDAVTEFMGHEIEVEPGVRILVGAMLVVFGLGFPGIINWFVASARDANLFS